MKHEGGDGLLDASLFHRLTTSGVGNVRLLVNQHLTNFGHCTTRLAVLVIFRGCLAKMLNTNKPLMRLAFSSRHLSAFKGTRKID